MKTLDLCRVGLAERNTLVARRFAELRPGDAIEVVTDAPPWVLYHQLMTDRFGEVAWTMVESGPERWVVQLGRRGPVAAAS
jgi:uncharacterized protein (DUF2249 family)